MVSLSATGIFAVLVVLVLMSPKVIKAISDAYVAKKRVDFETKEKHCHPTKTTTLNDNSH